jgi:outer membrane protein TolC
MSYGFRARGLSDMLSVQVSVSLPIFPRNRQDRGIAARTADLAAVRAEHEDARRQQAERVQSAWTEWQVLGEQVRRHRELVLPLASDRSALALAAYRGGADIQPLLEARRDELTHHAEYAHMQAEYGRAWAALAYLLPESEMP